ncbi:unnamed protein product [Lactuca saligna]|uniref:RRM domain-containing protein n=1 Tax=Lactuca saligna TaxID=75948 RepID=A0AA35Y2T8_LACSI|nr:unnamed protein product [Lactuca saligna]
MVGEGGGWGRCDRRRYHCTMDVRYSNISDEEGCSWIYRNSYLKNRNQEGDNNGWHKGDTSKSASNSYGKDLDRVASSLYITNFPSYFDVKSLWKLCEGQVKIVDAYITTKQSKLGKEVWICALLGNR